MKKYQIIYADPPWEYKASRCLATKSCLSGDDKNHYSYMTLEDICKLPVKFIADNNCLLFLWTTGPKLNLAFSVIESWGFEYATVGFVWEKIKMNPGYYTMSSTEFCLIGRKGNIPNPRGERNIHQFYREERSKHSKKPNGIRKLIDKMFPFSTKIELFARDKIDGWDVWGNEVESDIDLEGIIKIRKINEVNKESVDWKQVFKS